MNTTFLLEAVEAGGATVGVVCGEGAARVPVADADVAFFEEGVVGEVVFF